MKDPYWWLSFADEEGNRGVCIVQASDFLSAVSLAHSLEINPGGQVQGIEMPDIPEAREEIELWGTDRLITPAELRADGYKSSKELEEE